MTDVIGVLGRHGAGSHNRLLREAEGNTVVGLERFATF